MNVVTIAIGDLFEFEGQAPPAARPDDETLRTMARRQFAFLPEPLQIEVEETAVTVRFPRESEASQHEAARLAQRAAKQAAAGEFDKAIPLLKRVLGLHPTLHQARRDLAMACLETSDIDGAKNHLIEVLRLNPGDAWSWVILGNIYVRDPKEWGTAEKFFSRALSIAPADPWAINGLATIAGRRGHTEEAVRLFKDAIVAKPELPNAHFGLAVTHQRSQQTVLALCALDDLFAKARQLDARSQPVFEQARHLYSDLQAGEAARLCHDAMKMVDDFRAKVEQESGFPVRLVEGEFKDTTGATIQLAWKHGRDHHVVTLRKGLEDVLRPHLIAHEFTHLQLETEARKVGKNRFFVTTESTDATADERLQSGLRKLERTNLSENAKRGLLQIWKRGTVNLLFNCPLDMVIETRLRERMPELAAIQFTSTRAIVQETLSANSNREIRNLTPTLVLRACLALNGAYALFLDSLYRGATAYAEFYKKEESFTLAQRLFGHWQMRSQTLGPGDEYTLVDEFSEILGMRGWFEWRPDSGLQPSLASAGPEGTTNLGLLQTKSTASVRYLLDALKRYDQLPADKVREIAVEIGVIGQRGLDYASPEKKYELKSILGERFSGLHLMCLMFAGFKRIAPEESLGMDLEEPFLRALELFQASR